MTTRTTSQRAVSLVEAMESRGKTVRRVIVDGRRIELELANGEPVDDFDAVDMEMK